MAGSVRSPDRARERRRVFAVAAAVVAASAVLVVVIALVEHNRTPATATASLEGVTWADTASPGQIIFRGDRINIFDSCTGGWHALTSSDHSFVIGNAVGIQQTCSPPAGWSPPGIGQFDRVVSGRLAWTLEGDTLTLTNVRGGSIKLRAEPSAPPAGCLSQCSSGTPG